MKFSPTLDVFYTYGYLANVSFNVAIYHANDNAWPVLGGGEHLMLYLLKNQDINIM